MLHILFDTAEASITGEVNYTDYDCVKVGSAVAKSVLIKDKEKT